MPETNTIGYYRTALKTLGEPFFERRVLVDIEAEPTWEKKGRKAARFQDSGELRQALEDALRRYGVRAVVIDEAQHLMKVGTGAKLLDQFEFIPLYGLRCLQGKKAPRWLVDCAPA